MRRTMTESPENEADWARVCGPLSRTLTPDEELVVIQRDRVHTPEVNAHFMYALSELDLRPVLAAVTEPMLVLAGEKDPLAPTRLAAEIREHASRADVAVHVVDCASHQILCEQPLQAFDLVREFARVATGRGLAT